MTRTKWLTLSLAKSTSEISDLLYTQKYLRGHATGFELTDVQRNRIRGKFIEEIIVNEVIIDPFGEEVLNNVRRYSIFEFQISPLKKHQFLVRINNPPRTLKNFIAALTEAFGFGFAIEQLNIDILAMIQHLRRTSDIKRWAIVRVRMANIPLGNSSLAKIEVLSNGDAYQDLQKCMDVKKATLERATVELTDNDITNQIELVSTGVISGEMEVLDQLMPMFQTYFD
ncbi:MAG: hypothetical protein KJ795_07465 [Gammaproteobacteria bacterium]|nr:hypothetical protein [Gammaproteobacteria bacterium]MBU1777135.1 hypothetical protein [Gammaproteobacteria bacterium]MBU1969824.1 hypothetical protein [Gammaproteobacteria bacterium]